MYGLRLVGAVVANSTQCEELGCTEYCDPTWAWVGGICCGFIGGIFFTLSVFGITVLILWLINYRRGALIERIRSKLGGGLDESPSYESLSGLDSDLDPPQFSVGDDSDFTGGSAVSAALVLSVEDTLDPVDYQGLWEGIEQYIEEDFVMRKHERLLDVLKRHYIFCIASGLVEAEERERSKRVGRGNGSSEGRQVMKYYTYAMSSTEDVVFMMEIVVDISSGASHATMKTNCSKEGRNFMDYFFTTISALISHALPLDDDSFS